MPIDLPAEIKLVPPFLNTGIAPQSNINKLFSILKDKFQEIVDVNNSLRELTISTAYGQTLDNFGGSYDLPRQGLSDDTYRALLLAKQFNLVNGNDPDPIEEFLTFFLGSGALARVVPLWFPEVVTLLNGFTIYRAFSVEVGAVSVPLMERLTAALQLLRAAGIYAVINFKEKINPTTDIPGGTWVAGTGVTVRAWRAVCWSGNKFLIAGRSPIVGQIGAGISTPFIPTNESVFSYFGGLVLYFDHSGATPVAYYSSDNGATWTAQTLPGGTTAYGKPSVASGRRSLTQSQNVIVVFNFGANANSYLSSVDGTTWVNRDFTGVSQFISATGADFGGVVHLGNTFVFSGKRNGGYTVAFWFFDPQNPTGTAAVNTPNNTALTGGPCQLYTHQDGYAAHLLGDNVTRTGVLLGHSQDGVTWSAIPGVSAAIQESAFLRTDPFSGIYCFRTTTTVYATTDFVTVTAANKFVQNISASNGFFWGTGVSEPGAMRSKDGVTWEKVGESGFFPSSRTTADTGSRIIFWNQAGNLAYFPYDNTYEDQTLELTSADGQTWSVGAVPPGDWHRLVKGDTATLLFDRFRNIVSRTLNDGATWENIDAGFTWQFVLASPNVTNSDHAGYCFRNGFFFKLNAGSLYKSSDNGTTWAQRAYDIDLDGFFNNSPLVATPTSLVALFQPRVAGVGLRCARSLDDGVTWSFVDALASHNFTVSAAAFGNGKIMAFAGTPSPTLGAISDDDGLTWSLLTIPNLTYSRLVYSGGAWIAITSTGGKIAFSYDDGATWQQATVENDNYRDVWGEFGIFVAVASNGTQGAISSRLILPA